MHRQNCWIPLGLALMVMGVSVAAETLPTPAATQAPTQQAPAQQAPTQSQPVEIPAAIRALDGQLVLASGHGKTVRLQDLREAAAAYVSAGEQARFWQTQALMTETLGSLYRQQVLAEKARAAKLDLPDLGQTVPASMVQRNRDLANLYLDHEVRQRQPTDAALERFAKTQYAQAPNQYKHGDIFRASHILIRVAEGVRTDAQGLARANDVLARLKQGEDFGALAAEFSEDRDTRNKKGSLDFREAHELPADFVAILKNMKPGSMSQTPAKTSFGYHVIWLQEVRPEGRLSFDDVKDRLMAVAAQKVEIRTRKALWDEALSGFQVNTANVAKVAAAQNAP